MTCQWCPTPPAGKMLMGKGAVLVCRHHFDYCTSILNNVLTYDDRPCSRNKKEKDKWVVFEPRVLLAIEGV